MVGAGQAYPARGRGGANAVDASVDLSSEGQLTHRGLAHGRVFHGRTFSWGAVHPNGANARGGRWPRRASSRTSPRRPSRRAGAAWRQRPPAPLRCCARPANPGLVLGRFGFSLQLQARFAARFPSRCVLRLSANVANALQEGAPCALHFENGAPHMNKTPWMIGPVAVALITPPAPSTPWRRRDMLTDTSIQSGWAGPRLPRVLSCRRARRSR